MTTRTAPVLIHSTAAGAPAPVHTLSVYVANKPGVLARIAQCFARRGFNIESLVVSPAMDGNFSRMTIGCSGNPDGLEQIIKQVSKLIDVLRCVDHADDDAVVVDLALIKIHVSPDNRRAALRVSKQFGCRNMDMTGRSMIMMCMERGDRVDALLRRLRKFRIVEMVRTGKVVMARGAGRT